MHNVTLSMSFHSLMSYTNKSWYSAQSELRYAYMLLKLLGIKIFVLDPSEPKLFMVGGSVGFKIIESSLVHLSNALFPIDITRSGIVILFSL